MSSLARRVQIRALKRRGYRRLRQAPIALGGVTRMIALPKGKRPIVDRDGGLVGMRWPGLGRQAVG